MMASTQVRLLARHFFWRFFDSDLVSPDSDAHEAASLAIAFLAAPGILVSALLFLKYGNPWLSPPERLGLAVGDKLQFISWSMTVMSLATIVVWDALALDARDYAILGPLPIARRTLLAGKLLAIAMFVGVFALAVNAVPMVLYPLAFLSSSRLSFGVSFWVMIGYAVSCLGAAAFGFLVVVTVRSLLLNVFGPRLFRRVSLVTQFVMALVILTSFSSVSADALGQGGRGLYLSPPMWFLGLYETITNRGIMATLSPDVQRLYGLVDLNAPLHRQTYVGYWPAFQRLALVAVAAFAACALVASVLYFASHFRHASHLRQAAALAPAGPRWLRRAAAAVARRLIVRDPIAQASFFFTLQTLARSARHKLYLAGYFLVGCVLSYTTLVSLSAARGVRAAAGPGAAALSLQIVLSFFLLVGIRVVFTIPADLRANWVFRLTTRDDVRRYLKGVRRAVGAGVVVPFLAALWLVHAVLWGPGVAALHFACGVLAALVLFEVLLLNFEKLPFTCPHVSGKANVKIFWPGYLLGFSIYTSGLASLEAAAFRTSSGSIALVAGLLLALGAVVLYRNRVLARRSGFVFDEAPDPALVTLGL
jgi:hypothetical protein